MALIRGRKLAWKAVGNNGAESAETNVGDYMVRPCGVVWEWWLVINGGTTSISARTRRAKSAWHAAFAESFVVADATLLEFSGGGGDYWTRDYHVYQCNASSRWLATVHRFTSFGDGGKLIGLLRG